MFVHFLFSPPPVSSKLFHLPLPPAIMPTFREEIPPYQHILHTMNCDAGARVSNVERGGVRNVFQFRAAKVCREILATLGKTFNNIIKINYLQQKQPLAYLQISKSSRSGKFVTDPFLMMLQIYPLVLLEEALSTGDDFCNLSKISRNNYFSEHLQATV